jgi:hypothetical protein
MQLAVGYHVPGLEHSWRILIPGWGEKPVNTLDVLGWCELSPAKLADPTSSPDWASQACPA